MRVSAWRRTGDRLRNAATVNHLHLPERKLVEQLGQRLRKAANVPAVGQQLVEQVGTELRTLPAASAARTAPLPVVVRAALSARQQLAMLPGPGLLLERQQLGQE